MTRATFCFCSLARKVSASSSERDVILGVIAFAEQINPTTQNTRECNRRVLHNATGQKSWTPTSVGQLSRM